MTEASCNDLCREDQEGSMETHSGRRREEGAHWSLDTDLRTLIAKANGNTATIIFAVSSCWDWLSRTVFSGCHEAWW